MSEPNAKERALERAREWKRRNREHVSAYRRAYYEKNHEREAEKNREWCASNPEKMRRYAKGHAPYIRDWQALRKAERTGLVAMFQPSQVREDYGHQCWACGSGSDLCMDHITPLSRGGSNFGFNLRTLCADCNRRKNTRMDHEVSDVQFRQRLLVGHAVAVEVLR